jgi:hypothetical protein
MLQLLRHFAVYTNQKQKHMTYLLTLFKLYEPIPCYSLLPSTGKALLKIDGSDWPITSNESTPLKLPAAIPINEGHYIHFGIENALNGSSVGLIHRDADLIQFVDLYRKQPGLLPEKLRDRVRLVDYVYKAVHLDIYNISK